MRGATCVVRGATVVIRGIAVGSLAVTTLLAAGPEPIAAPVRQITVVDDNSGRPLEHAVVTVQSRPPVAFITGRDGRVRVDASQPVTDVSRAGYLSGGTESFEGFPRSTPRTIRLQPEAVLSGKVIDIHGEPVVSATVGVIRLPAKGGNSSNAGRPIVSRTDDRGVYRVSMASGRYLMSVTEPAGPGASPPAHPFDLGSQSNAATARAVDSIERGVPFELKAGRERRDVVVQLPVTAGPRPQGTAIAGIVVDDAGIPVERATIRIFPASRMDGDVAQWTGGPFTDSRGAFRLWGLPPGAYYVLAQRTLSNSELMRDVRGRSQSVALANAYCPGVERMQDARQVVIADAREIGDVNIRMPIVETAPVTVTVTPSNATLMSATVALIQDADGGAISEALGQGKAASFTFRGVRRGHYRAIAESFVAEAPHSPGLGALQWGSTEFDVTPGGVNVTTVPVAWGVKMSGRVESDGAPLPRDFWSVTLIPKGSVSLLGHYVSAIAWGFTAGGPRFFVEAYDADPEGHFLMPSVPPGAYLIEWRGPRGWRATAAMLDGRDILQTAVVVNEHDNIGDIVIRVTNR